MRIPTVRAATLANSALSAAVVSALAIPALAVPRLAMAQEAESIEEVLVTARKRSENLQRVPDSITAFTEAQIAERRLDHIAEAIALTPNVHMVNDQGKR